MPKKTGSKEKASGALLSIDWHYPDDVIGRFANHMVVQADENEYHVSFFEVKPPLVLGTEAEKRAQIEGLGSIRANCVGRIIISKERLPRFVETLQAAIDRQKTPGESTKRKGEGL